MIFRKHFILLSLICLGFLYSCDIIDGEKKCYTCLSAASSKKILLEDFTGHYCGNCPRSHEEAEFLDSLYHDTTIIVLNLHGGAFFSSPHLPLYAADYRTPLAVGLDSFYHAEGTEGYPIGMVNRRSFNSSVLVKYADFGTRVGSMLSELPGASIDLQSVYNAGTNSTDITVDAEMFSSFSNGVSLNVVVKEDSIISIQSDYDHVGDSVQNYVHMNMHRFSATSGLWGETLNAGAVSQGDVFNKSYTITLDAAWVPKNCSVVAFLLDLGTKEVIQAAEVKLGAE